MHFDEVSVTVGYLGDTSSSSFWDRDRHLDNSNYRQIVATKRFGQWIAASGDYTWLVGVPTVRAAATVKTGASGVVDLDRRPSSHTPTSAEVVETSATRPADVDTAVVPIASGTGRFTVPALPCASCTRKHRPGSIAPVSGVTTHAPVPAALEYRTDQPARLTGAVPALNSSTSSFLNVAPELPPPYTWLMTMCEASGGPG